MIQHSKTKTIYTGVTSNLQARIKKHNSNTNPSTYRKDGKWFLFYAEVYRSKEDAYKRESKLKKHGRAKQEILRRAEDSLPF